MYSPLSFAMAQNNTKTAVQSRSYYIAYLMLRTVCNLRYLVANVFRIKRIVKDEISSIKHNKSDKKINKCNIRASAWITNRYMFKVNKRKVVNNKQIFKMRSDVLSIEVQHKHKVRSRVGKVYCISALILKQRKKHYFLTTPMITTSAFNNTHKLFRSSELNVLAHYDNTEYAAIILGSVIAILQGVPYIVFLSYFAWVKNVTNKLGWPLYFLCDNLLCTFFDVQIVTCRHLLENRAFASASLCTLHKADFVAKLRLFTMQYIAYFVAAFMPGAACVSALRELFFILHKEKIKRTRARYYGRVLRTRLTRAVVSNAIPPCGGDMRILVIKELKALFKISDISPVLLCEHTMEEAYDQCLRQIDISFFLNLNYGIDLLYLFKFSRFVGATTVGAALQLMELECTNFLSTYFLYAVSSYTAYLNNVCSINTHNQLICIGDFIEVREQSVYTDLLLIVINMLHMCSLFFIKKQWFFSFFSLLCPFIRTQVTNLHTLKKHYYSYPRWNIAIKSNNYVVRPIFYSFYSHLVRPRYSEGRNRINALMRQMFPQYINDVEKTIGLYICELFMDATLCAWNISLRYNLTWRFCRVVRNTLYTYNKFKKKQKYVKVRLFKSVYNKVILLQSSFARYIFCTYAYCAKRAVSIINDTHGAWVRIADTKKSAFLQRLRKANSISKPLFFSNLWDCRLGTTYSNKIKHDVLFAWLLGENRVLARSNKKAIPFFWYQLYRISIQPIIRSFRKSTALNAVRYASLFTVFYLFFKYSSYKRHNIKVKHSPFSWVMWKQRRFAKATNIMLRKRLLGMWWWRGRARKPFKRKRKIVKAYKALIKRYSKAKLKMVDFLALLELQKKLPRWIKRPWWVRLVKKKPWWLFRSTKPWRVRTNKPWWHSVSVLRARAVRRFKRVINYKKMRIRRKNKKNRKNRRWPKYYYSERSNRAISRRTKKWRSRYWGRGPYSKTNILWYKSFARKNRRALYSVPKSYATESIRNKNKVKKLRRYIVYLLTLSKKHKVWSPVYKFFKKRKKKYNRRQSYLIDKVIHRQYSNKYDKKPVGAAAIKQARIDIDDAAHRRNNWKKKKQASDAAHQTFMSAVDQIMNISDNKSITDVKSDKQARHKKRYIRVSKNKHVVLNNNSMRVANKRILLKRNNYKRLKHVIAHKKWRAIGIKGSFFKDAKLLSIFLRSYLARLATVKKKRILHYKRSVIKYINLFSLYLKRFNNVNVLSNVSLLKYILTKYKKHRHKFFLKRNMYSVYSKRLLYFFFSLGKLHQAYKASIQSIVSKCVSNARIAALTHSTSYASMSKPDWWSTHIKPIDRSIMIHYFTRNMLLGPELFSVYGSNILIFSLKNIKLHICLDAWGYEITCQLFDTRIEDLFYA
jgi:hypothetical protein